MHVYTHQFNQNAALLFPFSGFLFFPLFLWLCFALSFIYILHFFFDENSRGGGGAYNSQRAPRSSNAYINGGGVIRSHLKHLSSPSPLIYLQDYTYRWIHYHITGYTVSNYGTYLSGVWVQSPEFCTLTLCPPLTRRSRYTRTWPCRPADRSACSAGALLYRIWLSCWILSIK